MALFNFGVLADRQEADRAVSRDRIAQAKDNERRRQALQSLPGILSRRDMRNVPIDQNDAVLPLPPDIAQQMQQGFEGQRQIDLLGVLGTAAPEAVLQGVLGQQFPQQGQPSRAQSTLDMMTKLGFDHTPEGFTAFNQSQAKGSSNDILDQLIKVLQLQGLQRDSDADNKRLAEQEAQKSNSINEVLSLGFETALKGAALEGTGLEPGKVGLDERRQAASIWAEVQDLFGNESRATDIRKGVTDLNTFTKNTKLLVNSMATKMAAADLAPDSKFELEQLIQASANPDLDVQTNNAILARTMKLALKEADAGSIEIEGGRSRLDAMIEQLETGRKRVFSSEDEVTEAFNSGRLQMGDVVVVNGKARKLDPNGV